MTLLLQLNADPIDLAYLEGERTPEPHLFRGTGEQMEAVPVTRTHTVNGWTTMWTPQGKLTLPPPAEQQSASIAALDLHPEWTLPGGGGVRICRPIESAHFEVAKHGSTVTNIELSEPDTSPANVHQYERRVPSAHDMRITGARQAATKAGVADIGAAF